MKSNFFLLQQELESHCLPQVILFKGYNGKINVIKLMFILHVNNNFPQIKNLSSNQIVESQKERNFIQTNQTQATKKSNLRQIENIYRNIISRPLL